MRLEGRLHVPVDLPLQAVSFVALTDEQEQAVERRAERLSLSAAAGSGKTSVLVERFVRAIRVDGIAPGRILAITFTDRAAGELRARVRARLLELGERQAARDTEAAFVGTFHGFCARLLRAHPLAADLDPGFAILDQGLAGRLADRAFTLALEGFLDGRRPDAVDLVAAYRIDRVHSIVAAAHAELRSRGEIRPRLPAAAIRAAAGSREAIDREAAVACGLLDELLERYSQAYEQLKAGRGSLDFDDLELRAGALLAEHQGVRTAWSERFELLMVDEFQDTNPRQLAILAALERENLFTVGDEFQSIYGFRHADVGLFRGRRDELAARGGSLALRSNFRSRPALLEVVNEVFGQRFEGYEPLLAGRAVADGGGPGPEVELLLTDTRGWEEAGERAAPAQVWRQAEADALARRVKELIDEGTARAGDVAVLLRAGGDLELFERALKARGLQTLAAVGAFWEDQQVCDLLAYLGAVANPLDDLALYSTLASPLAGCTLDALASLAAAARGAGTSVWEMALRASGEQDGDDPPLLSRPDRAAVGRLCAMLADERADAPRRTISELIERAVGAGGYRRHVEALDWPERRLANIHKLLRLTRRFEAVEGRDLRGFLDHVEHLRAAAAAEPDAPVVGVEPDAVRLMTTHAAKGLEFPVVCVADLGRRPYVQTPDLLLDGERIGLRLVRLDGGESTNALDYDALCEERRRREAEEEDRILYVAMTRARDRLLLSGGVDFGRWPAAGGAPVSWLVPALAPELPERLGAGDDPVGLQVGPSAVSVSCRLNRASTAEQDASRPAPGPPAPDDEPALAGSAPAEPDRARAAPGARAIESLSYSSLSELERCGYRFYLERVLRLPEDREAARGGDGGLQARARGTLVHSLMEDVDFAAPRPPDEADVERSARALGLRMSKAECREVSALVAGALPAPLAERFARANVLGRERAFGFALGPGEPLLNGVIDLLAVEPGGNHLVLDYKSDRVEDHVALEAHVERDYGVQRLIYALAVLRTGAPSVEVVHWFLARPREPVSAVYEAAGRPELERSLQALTASVEERSFVVSARPHRGLCLTCPGRRGLCSWGERETMRELPEDSPAGGDEDAQEPLRLF
jgi:ATP-dependent helicase/nuclease subunit A